MAGWMAAIFALSSLTATAIESAPTAAAAARSFPSLANQITVHVAEFGVLAVLGYRAADLWRPTSRRYLWIVVLALTIAYAVTDELHQSFVPGRHATWLDVVYDAVGAAGGVAAAAAWSLFRSRIGGRGSGT